MNALRSINRKATLQTEQAKPGQVKNNAGGFVFKVSDKTRLERFLILGTDGGTYYSREPELTKDNVKFVTELIVRDEDLVRNTLVDVSVNGRAYRQSPALFTLALLLVDGKNKAATRAVFNDVARTSTHLFEVAQYIENLGGWGRAKRTAVAEWYENKDADKLAYQLVKYRSRNGWTHRDTLRLSHPKGLNAAIAPFALRGEVTVESPEILHGFAKMQATKSVAGVVKVLNEYPNLPWETIPTQFLNNAEVWKTLFRNGQLRGQNALRNVKRLNTVGAFDDMVFAREFVDLINDPENVQKSRLHPINYLNAIVMNANRVSYWNRERNSTLPAVITDGLSDGFHGAFKYITPSNKRTLIGLDVSGSMLGGECGGFAGAPAEAGAAIAMTVARTEPYYAVMGFSTTFVDLGISPGMRLDSVLRVTSNLPFSGTNIALPMEWALKNKVEVETFIVITDNETWAGRTHPFQALKKYRQEMGIDARLAVMGMTPTDFTVADPSDQGMMDFVGMDSNTPRVLADFSAGRI